jgi:hypothetical protein
MISPLIILMVRNAMLLNSLEMLALTWLNFLISFIEEELFSLQCYGVSIHECSDSQDHMHTVSHPKMGSLFTKRPKVII